MSADDLAWVEAEVNARVREDAEVVTRLMTPEAAVAAGAMALFGEKYGEEVRVVGMGHDPSAAERHGVYSLELCGGTHVRRTGEIGLFKIVSEGAVAAGVRRVEALCGEAALRHVEQAERLLSEAAAVLKAQPAELPARIAALLEEKRRLERELSDARRQLATGGAAGGVEEVNGLRLAARDLGETPARELKGLAEAILKGGTADVVALVSRAEGKASIVVALAETAKGRADAVALVRAASAAVGGKGGGGRPDMAQAGGPDADRAAEALAAIRAALAA
jgi:alanyl-tRNA synthetase